jgi:hypothetical protein
MNKNSMIHNNKINLKKKREKILASGERYKGIKDDLMDQYQWLDQVYIRICICMCMYVCMCM